MKMRAGIPQCPVATVGFNPLIMFAVDSEFSGLKENSSFGSRFAAIGKLLSGMLSFLDSFAYTGKVGIEGICSCFVDIVRFDFLLLFCVIC